MKKSRFQAKALLKAANCDINKIEYAYELARKQENNP